MNNKQRKEQLHAARVFNDHDLARVAGAITGWPCIYIWYRTQETGRAYRPAVWQVVHPGYKTDPLGYWSDYGNKTFMCTRETKDAQRQAAIRWASERYRFDPEDWAPSPFGRAYGWFPRLILKSAFEAVEAGAHFSRQDGSLVYPEGLER